MRTWVAGAGRRAGAGARAATPYGILAFLTASAIVPVAGAGLASSAEAAAALGQLGGLGSSYLAEVLSGTADRMRRQGGQPDEEGWRDALAETLEPLLAGQDERARALREDTGRILRAVGAVQVAITESTRGTHELRDDLARALRRLGDGTEELHWMLAEAQGSLGQLLEQVTAQGGERRQQTDLMQQTLVAIAQLRAAFLVAPPVPAPTVPAPTVAAPPVPVPDGTSDTGVPPPPAVPCPYPGLASFQPTDAPWFFGREQLTARVVGRLAEQLGGAGPLVLVGVSGVGKSSLLRAGVLPTLTAGALDTGGHAAATPGAVSPGDPGTLGEPTSSWPWMLLSPGAQPLTELVSRTAALAGEPAVAAVRAIRDRPEDFAALATQAALATGRPSTRLVIAVDQFEEVFTQCEDPAERAGFVTALTHAGRALVVLAVRADFYADCTRLPELARVLAAGHLVVGPLDTDGLRRAVVEPARLAGLSVEDGLVELLLADLGVSEAGYDPGRLPLLAHVLRAAWWQQRDGRLTVARYRETGGIRNAIADTAERIYRGLDDDGRARLRTGLLRLVTVTEGRALTRRRGTLQDLDRDLLQRLVATRLVVAGDDGIELSHEALLTGWPRLAGWLEESRTELLLRQRVQAAAQAWAEAGENADLLYRGTQLAAAREWARDRDDLAERERRFLDAGARAAAAAEAAWARTTRRLRRRVAGLAVALVLALVATAIAVVQTGTVQQREAQARSRQHAAEARATSYDGRKARLLALQAWQDSHTPEARGALLSVQTFGQVAHLGSDPGGTAVAVARDGTQVAIGFGDGRIERWDPTALRPIGPPLATGLGRMVNTAAYSGSGRLLVTGSMPGKHPEETRATTVWDATTGRRVRDLPGAGFATWRPGTDHVLSLYYDADPRAGTVTLAVGEWDPADGRRLASVPVPATGPVNSLAVSPDGARIALCWSDGVTRVFRLADGALLATIQPTNASADPDVSFSPGAPLAVSAVFSDDGNLVTGQGTEDLRVWALPSGRLLRTLPANRPLAGRRLATMPGGYVCAPGTGGVVECWHEPTGTVLTPTADVFSEPARDIAISGDGRLVATTGTSDPTVVFRGSPDLLHHPHAVTDARFDPTGRTIATASGDGTLRFWPTDGTAAGPPAPAHRYPGAVRYLGFSPDGRLAFAVADGTVHLRAPDGTDRTIMTLEGTRTANAVLFSPDGGLLAVATSARDIGADRHGRVIVWDTRQVRVRERLDTGAREPSALAFSPDGNRLIAATFGFAAREDLTFRREGVITMWRTDDLSLLGSYSAGPNQVLSLATDPAGTTLALAGTNRRIELRRLDDGHLLRTITQPFTVRRVAYSPDGRTLATATTGGFAIRLWDPRTGALTAELTRYEGALNSLQFSPDGKRLAIADTTGTVTLQDVDPTDTVTRICRDLRAAAPADAGLPEPCATAPPTTGIGTGTGR